ncbi:MAG TPA: hypothetical protein VHP55_08395, partial [Usitatibacter sp.]|nr:hypothetical protein [Usitatibacter sp.]
MPESAWVKAPLVSAKPFGFVIVKVIVLVEPTGIDVGENDLAIVGAPATDRDAEAAAPAGAWALVAVLVVLVTEVAAATVCVMEQLAFGGIVPALKPTDVPPL